MEVVATSDSWPGLCGLCSVALDIFGVFLTGFVHFSDLLFGLIISFCGVGNNGHFG
jgi:hypothetical protein